MDLPTQIETRLAALGVKPADVEERFVRGAGPGGQKINKTSSTVWLRHGPSGIEVKCQAALAEREKERRRKRTRSAAQKRRMVADKRKRSLVKQNRGRVRGE